MAGTLGQTVAVSNSPRTGLAVAGLSLGTALNLPMTTITLVEDLGMAAMAAVMLVIGSA